MTVEAPWRAVTLDEVRTHRDAIMRLDERFGVLTQVATPPGGLKFRIRDRVLREAVAL